MAQARARVATGAERPRIRPIRPAAPDYGTVLRECAVREGACVGDGDGREFVDFVNEQGQVLLGWNDPEVEARALSGANPELLEIEAARRLGALIPSADAVGFRATFEQALADALLAAKTLTGRDGAFFCDEAASAAGDIAAVEQVLDRFCLDVAAVVIRPMEAPRRFLSEVRRMTVRSGAILIFDERKSALRVHPGGAQARAGVVPDMTLLGASIANGLPLAAIAGALEPMRAMCGSGMRIPAAALASACVTLQRVDEVDASRRLRASGAALVSAVELRIADCGLAPWLEVVGDATWSILCVRPDSGVDADAMLSAVNRGLYDHGVLSQGAHVLSLACGEAEVGRLLAAYEAVLPPIALRAVSGAFARRTGRRAS